MPRHFPFISVGEILEHVQAEHGLVRAKERPHQVDLTDGIADEQDPRDEKQKGETRAWGHTTQATTEDPFHPPESRLGLGLLFQRGHQTRHGFPAKLVVWNGSFPGRLEQEWQPARTDAPQEVWHPRHHCLPREHDGDPLIVDDISDSVFFFFSYGHVFVGQ